MRIEPIQPEQAGLDVQRIYRSLQERLGAVTNFYKMLAHKPALLRAFTQLYGAIWEDGALDPRLKELAYLRTSIANGCDYWTRSHTASGKRRGLTDGQIAALKEPGGRRRNDVFSEQERAILRFTDLLTSYPGNVDDVDLDALSRHLSPDQVVELVGTIATANWTNRVNDGLRTPITWYHRVLTSELGRTGLQVTPLGLGLAALGRPAYINLGREQDLGADRSVPALRRDAHDVLDAAYDAGLRYIDVARSYGLSEEFLAGWLEERGVAPDDLTVGSKWGYRYTGGWRLDAEVNEVKDHTLPALLRQYGESRALLGAHLDLYQVHSATLESGILEDRAVLSELVRMRADGLMIGASVSGSRQTEVIRRVVAIDVDGVNPFGTIQATWNLLEPSAGPALAEANDAGFGVILKEVLANGRLTARGDGLPAALQELARAHDTSLDRLATAAALANPWAGVVLSGAVTVNQLESNLEALNLKIGRLDEATLASIAEPADRYWSERQSLRWD